MFKTIALVVTALIAIILGYAATLPDTFRIERSTNIQAPPEKIFALINDFHSWETWSPWEKLDATMKRTYSGAEKGKGAVYAWDGSDKVGSGRMEITSVTEPNMLTIQLDFIKPFAAQNITEYMLKKNGDSTTVTWAMTGPTPYLSKVMQIFVSMDSMIAKDFEKGLANMKAVAEKP